jgi:hypothetical protein
MVIAATLPHGMGTHAVWWLLFDLKLFIVGRLGCFFFQLHLRIDHAVKISLSFLDRWLKFHCAFGILTH